MICGWIAMLIYYENAAVARDTLESSHVSVTSVICSIIALQ